MGGAGNGVCDVDLVQTIKTSVEEFDFLDEIIEDMDFGGGEDFTLMMERVQSKGGKATEMMIGTPLSAPHHNGKFDIDEKAISIGAQVFAKIALDLCK